MFTWYIYSEHVCERVDELGMFTWYIYSEHVCERVDELGMFTWYTYTQNIHNLFTRSHPSEDENRIRNRSKKMHTFIVT
jgi:hypothetical protein